MERLWETAAARAIHLAFHVNGCTVGGTSAGAAVMSRAMLATGEATLRPEKDVVSMDIGLGLLPRAIVDQHFNERGRLGRLLSPLAQRPDLLGAQLHLLTSGHRDPALPPGTPLRPEDRRMPPALHEAMRLLTEPGAIRG
jgi:cyanophycinase-like exopeptidase